MSLFEDVLGANREEQYDTKELAASKVDEKLDVRTSSVSIEDADEPTQFEEFDNAYRKDSQVFQSINAKVQTIMAPGHVLRTDPKQDPEEKVLKYFQNFVDSVGNIGEGSTWLEVLESLFYSQMKYGRNQLELMYNKRHSEILDLLILDSKKIDFARDSSNNILLDKFNNVIGYTKQFPQQATVHGQGDDAPEDIRLRSKMIFMDPKRIAYFWLYGDKLDPVGLIEPGYKSVVYKQNVQEAQANSIYQRGLFPIIDYVGSPERFPTPKMIANATNKLKDMQHNRYFAFPYWHNIKALEVKQTDVVDSTIKSFKEEISASIGIPLVLSTGSGEATNKSTLKIQTQFLEYSLNDIVKRTLSSMRKNVFRRISELKKFRDNDGKLIIPFIVWGEIGVGSKDDKADRLVKLLKQGGITPEYVMPYVIESESLVKDEAISAELSKIIPKEKKEKKKSSDKKELGKSKSTGFSYSDVEKILRSL